MVALDPRPLSLLRSRPGGLVAILVLAVACAALTTASSARCVDAHGASAVAVAEPPFNVLIVGWDGVQRDHLRDCFDRRDPGCPNGLPGVARLSAGGGILPLTVTSAATSTIPGWVEILTGYDASALGITDNGTYRSVPAGYSLLEKVEQGFDAGRVVTIFVAAKKTHTGGDCTTSPPEPWCEARRCIDVFENGLWENRAVGERGLALIRQHGAGRFVAFLHFADPDRAVHPLGENAPEYSASLIDLDAWLGRLLDALAAQGIEQQTLVYLVSDHGFNENDKEHTAAPFTVLVTNDTAVVRGGDRKDVAATILVRLGLGAGAIGGAPPLAGQPLTTTPTDCVREGQAVLDYPNAPDCCAGLTRIDLSRMTDPSGCLAATGGTGDRSGYCTRCGDGLCAVPEHRCNCPGDCH